MTEQGEQLIRVPMEMVKIIPFFEGDARQLPLFIKKCEYILQSFRGGDLQNEYLFHVVTSRLGGEAANLVGERDQISTWEELKNVLGQHFGDPRSEECLAMELEIMKKNRDESYLDFCHRIQHLRSVLFSKVSENVQDINLKLAKQQIYNHTSLNVFLYNLPSYLVRLVRLRNVNCLEDALKIVLEEQNFQTVYDSKNTRNNFMNSNPRPNNFQNNYNFNNRFNRDFNVPRQLNSPRQYNSPVPSTSHSFNNQNSNMGNPNFNFSTPNNSLQSRNNYRQNNSFNYRNNAQPGQMPTRPMQSQQRPGSAPYSNMQTPMSSNTDATMRTASSRRINYIDANYGNSNFDCANNTDHITNREEVENFFIMASPLPKK